MERIATPEQQKFKTISTDRRTFYQARNPVSSAPALQALALYLRPQPGIPVFNKPVQKLIIRSSSFIPWQFAGGIPKVLSGVLLLVLLPTLVFSMSISEGRVAYPLSGDTITFRDTVCFSNAPYLPLHPEWNGGSVPRVSTTYYNLNTAGNVAELILTVLPIPIRPEKPSSTSRLFCLGQTSTITTTGNTSQYSWNVFPAGLASFLPPVQNSSITLQWTSDTTYTGSVKIVVRATNACGTSQTSDTLFGWLLNPLNPGIPAPRSTDSSICTGTVRSVVRTSFPSSQLLWGISPISAGGISNAYGDSVRINWNPNFTGDAFVFYNSNTPCGFKKSIRLKIRVRPKAASSITNLDSIYCQRTGAIVNLEGIPDSGSFFINNNPGDFLPVSQAGIFQVLYRPNGCFKESSRQVRVQAKGLAQITGLDTLRCTGQQPQTLAGQPPNGIFEVNGSPQINLLTPDSGIYLVSYRAFCTDTALVRVRVKPLPKPQILFAGNGICKDSLPANNLQLLPPGGSLFVDGNPAGNFIPSVPGMHELVYLFSNGICAAADTKTIAVDARPNLLISLENSQQTSFCRSDTLIKVSGWPEGGSFSPPLINGNAFNPALMPGGINRISYLGSNGACLDSASLQVKILDNPTISTSQISTDTLCQGGAGISLSAVSPPGGIWTGPGIENGVFLPKTGGINELTYSVPTIPGTACAASATISIFVRKGPEKSLGGDTSLCQNEKLLWEIPAGEYQFQWQDGSSGSSFLIDRPGIFHYRADQANCTWQSDTLHVKSVREPPVFSLGKSRDECFLEPVQVKGPPGMHAYRWEINGRLLSEDSTCQFEEPGTLKLEVTDRYSCRFSDEVYIRKDECPEVYVPEAFSPNGDGVNEVWKVFGRNIDNLSLSVFNSWGEVVFYGSGKDAAWNGRFKGSACPPGVYQFTLLYSGISPQKGPFSERMSGQVFLIR